MRLPCSSTYIVRLPLRDLDDRCECGFPTDEVLLGVFDDARTVYISHRINNVPAIVPMTIPATVPPDMQEHVELVLEARGCRGRILLNKVSGV